MKSCAQTDKLTPPSPTAASLGKYAEVPVSLYTGCPSIQIPLFEAKGRKLSVPIILSYHASGIKVNDISGWVGLGWSLQAGGIITRTVRGIADDLPTGYLSLHGNQLPVIGHDPDILGQWVPPGADELERNAYLEEIADGRADGEPDIFFFNLNGRTGKIIFDPEGIPIVVPHQNLAISYETNPLGEIISWQIIDESGIIYTLGTLEAIEVSIPINSDGTRQKSFYSSWYLLQMQTPNLDDDIFFNYSDYIVIRKDPIPHRKSGNEIPNREDIYQFNQTEIEGKFIRKITYSKGVVEFDTTSYHSYLGGRIYGLKSIRIKDLFYNKTIKSFKFDYSYYQTASYGKWYEYLPPSERLRLDRITEISSSGKESHPPYMFFYDETPLPPRGSFSQDHWGFFNGAKNEHLIPSRLVMNYKHYDSIPPKESDPRGVNIEKLYQINLNLPQLSENMWRTNGANREPNPDFLNAGSLKRIVYPTGGSTILEYEPHDYGYISLPRKRNLTKISAAYRNQYTSMQHNSRFLEIPYSQKIKIIPLFYILKGSIKDKETEDIPPDDLSKVYILKSPEIDEQADTIFQISYLDISSTAGGMEAEFHPWIEEGIYEVGAIAATQGDYTEIRVFSDSESEFDETYPIFSCEYEKTQLIVGEKVWIDNESSYRSEIVEITKDDENLFEIEVYFSSPVHPNQVSSFNLDFPVSRVLIRELDNPNNIIYETIYADQRIKWDKHQNLWILEVSANKHIKPGEYLVEFIPRIKTETGYISLTWNRAKKSNNYKIAGGLRIKRILEIDNGYDTIGIRDFKYTIEQNGTVRSSGVLQSWPVYHDLPGQIFYLNDNGNPANISYLPVNLYSSCMNFIGSTQGSYIGYRQVVESRPGAGKTVYKFTSSYEYPDISNSLRPYPKSTSFDWKRGLKKQIIRITEEGSIRETETYKYNLVTDTTHLTYIPSIVVTRKFPESNSAFLYQKYMNVSSWNYLEEENHIKRDIYGEKPIHYKTSYEFDKDHLQIKQIMQFDSDESEYIEKYYYPEDEEFENNEVVSEMRRRHMVNTMIKKEVFRDYHQIQGTKFNFSYFNQDKIYLSSTEDLEGSKYVEKVLFDKYDKYGNLLQYRIPGDIIHSLNWGLDGNYKIAEVLNSEHMDDVSNYPSYARMTKYTYLPLVGISSKTTPDGINTFFEYDNFGRLSQVRDHNRKILKHLDYNYKSYKGDTTRLYWFTPNLSNSMPPDNIMADFVVLSRNCTAHLAVEGGKLGTNAQWVWYKHSCGGQPIGKGSTIDVSPGSTTEYFVRAEGEANNTDCRSLTIEVVPASFTLLQTDLNFDFRGNENDPTVIETNYTGCDPWYVLTDSDWLQVISQTDNNFELLCFPNDSITLRTDTIFLYGDGNEHFLPVKQSGSVYLEMEYQPETVISGEDVTVTTQVYNGNSPYQFTWEKRLAGDNLWTEIASVIRDTPKDVLTLPSVQESFELCCKVVSYGLTFEKTVFVIVAE